MNSDGKSKTLQSLISIEPASVSASLQNFIRTNMKKLEREGVILGLSGGVDSAVVAALCKAALGSEKTLALVMPEKDSERAHVRDALTFAEELNIEIRMIDISRYLKILGTYRRSPLHNLPLTRKLREIAVKKAYKFYERKTGETPFSASLLGFKDKEFASYLKKGNAYYRIKHRLRMLLLYYYGELENRLIVGSANKTEYRIGFFVKHGCDDAADIMPLLSLYKTQVKELARHLNIPSTIIEKAPSPDIIPGITDEGAIGMPYEKLDFILLALENEWENSEIARVLGVEEKNILYVKNLVQKSAHMRQVYVPEN